MKFTTPSYGYLKCSSLLIATALLCRSRLTPQVSGNQPETLYLSINLVVQIGISFCLLRTMHAPPLVCAGGRCSPGK